jgi:hypothetical protein
MRAQAQDCAMTVEKNKMNFGQQRTGLMLVVAAQLMSGTALAQERIIAEGEPPSSDYEATPQGWAHKSCVVEVPDGGSAEDQADGSVVVKKDGKTLFSRGRCRFPLVRFRTTVVSASGGASRGKPINPTVPAETWVESNRFTPRTLRNMARFFSAMQSKFTVPEAPTSKDTQTIFFFSGLVAFDGGSSAIIQPVIQWNQSSAQRWQARNYYVANNLILKSQGLIELAPGDVVDGVMIANGCTSSGDCNWTLSVAKNGGSPSTMTTPASAWVFTDARPAVLEEYRITKCEQFPPGELAVFSEVYAYQPKTTNLGCTLCFEVAAATQPWEKIINAPAIPGLPDCGYDIAPITRGSTLQW